VDVSLEEEKGREELAKMKRQNPPNKSPLFRILGDISSQNNGASEGSADNLMLDSIGCTANVILFEDMKKLWVANAGDSRCVLAREGAAVALSVDHKPENEEEKARIEKAGSVIQEGRVDGNLNLSRAIGDMRYK
jgi:serine/threonine protein phosphatase PrpC